MGGRKPPRQPQGTLVIVDCSEEEGTFLKTQLRGHAVDLIDRAESGPWVSGEAGRDAGQALRRQPGRGLLEKSRAVHVAG